MSRAPSGSSPLAVNHPSTTDLMSDVFFGRSREHADAGTVLELREVGRVAEEPTLRARPGRVHSRPDETPRASDDDAESGRGTTSGLNNPRGDRDASPPTSPQVMAQSADTELSIPTTPIEGYLSRLGKYVPIEGLAPALPLAASAGGGAQVWTVWIAALVVGVALMLSQIKKDGDRPRAWFWPLVLVAFFLWTIGVSENFRDIWFDIGEASAAWWLGLGAFLIPGLDMLFETFWPRPQG